MNQARSRLPILTVAVLLVSVSSSVSALAQDATKAPPPAAAAAPPAAAPPPAPPPPPPPPPESEAPPHFPFVGGHVGIATPLVTLVSKGTSTNISNTGVILDPIGVTVHLTPKVAIDFEMVVIDAVAPKPTSTGLLVDPGIIYNAGPVALGLRVAFQPVGPASLSGTGVLVNQPASIGLIPLVNRGLVNFGVGTWFAEVAFPTFIVNDSVQFNIVLHTGIGF